MQKKLFFGLFVSIWKKMKFWTLFFTFSIPRTKYSQQQKNIEINKYKFFK